MDKKLAAEKIRQHLERRLGLRLNCESEKLPKLKIGTLIHVLYTLAGNQSGFGGFPTAMHGVIQLIGHSLTCDIEEEETKTEPAPREVIN